MVDKSVVYVVNLMQFSHSLTTTLANQIVLVEGQIHYET